MQVNNYSFSTQKRRRTSSTTSISTTTSSSSTLSPLSGRVPKDRGGNVKGLSRSNYPREINRILEATWNVGPHPPLSIVEALANKTGLLQKKIRQWFRNKRKRTKTHDGRSITWDTNVTPSQLNGFKEVVESTNDFDQGLRLAAAAVLKRQAESAKEVRRTRNKLMLSSNEKRRSSSLSNLLLVVSAVYQREENDDWKSTSSSNLLPACV